MNEPNMIKVAVTAAGGRLEAARSLGVSPWQITYWQRRPSAMPADKVRPLAGLTRGLVSVEALLGYIEIRSAPQGEKVAA